MFSGIGGFELGIEQSYEYITDQHKRSVVCKGYSWNTTGWSEQELPTCVGYSEIDKYAIQVYQSHFPNHKNFGNAATIDPGTIPDFDLLVGGFPCQSFSIAGKRRGFEDTRGTLFYDIARIAKAKQPMFMLLENVKGLVSHDGGKTLEFILGNLQELGYYVNYEVHNSKDYGVPQNRERIFFLCKHIKLLSSVGQNEKITTSESIIQEWLFQLLLNDLTEVKKLQGHASKDWVVGYLLCHAISQNQEWSAENILAGISMGTVAGSFQSMGDPWQNIDIWLKKNLEESSQELNTSTISTALRQIIESKTYTFSSMLKSILLATVLLRRSSSHLWNEVLLSLILIQEGTKYARINNKNEKAIITEDGTLHLSDELKDPSKYFTLGHLGGQPRQQVFPLGETTGTVDKRFEQTNSESEVAQTLRSRYGNGSGSHVAPTIRATQYKSGDNQTVVAVDTKQVGEPRFTENVAMLGANDYKEPKQVMIGMSVRRLTPKECERLQGFPDNWTAGVSDTQRYKMCGNAVTVNVVEAVMRRIVSP